MRRWFWVVNNMRADGRKNMDQFRGLFISALVWSICSPGCAAQEPQSGDLRPLLDSVKPALTLVGAVRIVESRYPRLLETQAQSRAAHENVRLQRVKEYMPDLMLSYQDVVGSHNRLTQTLFGSSVLPTTPGPGPERTTLRADAFSAGGFLVDWDPIDFGLHKARIASVQAQAGLIQSRFVATLLEAQVAAANRFLDATVMKEQITVAKANVESFADFSKVVHAQVESGLQAAADASLADAQLANAHNDLIRARLSYELARTSLALSVGMGGQPLDIEPGGIVAVTEPREQQKNAPLFESHPLALEGKAYVSTFLAERHVLDKEYYPRLRWLGGMNFRGTTFLTNRGDVPAADISGIFPYIPNWNVGLMIDWKPSDIVRIRAEKRVVDERIAGARYAYDAVIQSLQTEDAQARARILAAAELAANMPVQVHAAELAARQAQARYQAGLATVAQVTEANRLLAESRVKLAVASIGVWRASLDAASVHGNLLPFLAEADKATNRGR